VRSMGVVMIDILAKYKFELTPVEDQHSVETLSTDRADEPLGKGVGPWCSHRGADDPVHSDRKISSKLVVNLVS
jgi:hypothetical protein